MRKIKKLIMQVIDVFKKLLSLVFYILPINEKKIVFANFFGKGYGCNPKYLADEFLKQSEGYQLIWLVANMKDGSIPKGIKKVKYGSLNHYYHMVTAKLWIDNIRNGKKPLHKRKKQIYVQTWHGGVGVKAIEKDAETYLSKTYIRAAKRNGKIEDYILSGNEEFTELIKRAFWSNGEIVKLGNPRDDGLFNIDAEMVERKRIELGLKDKKVILYAPSFRVDPDFYNKLEFDADKITNAFNNKFGGEHVVAVRLHPNDYHKDNRLLEMENIVDFGVLSDAYLAFGLSNYIISDYSSVLFEFARIGGVSFIYAPDYENYLKTERGVYRDLKCYVFPFAQSFDELIKNVEQFSMDNYNKEMEKFSHDYRFYNNKESSRRIVDFLKKKMEESL